MLNSAFDDVGAKPGDYFPAHLRDVFRRAMSWAQLRLLTLVDSRKLLAVLQNFESFTVLHGHKHASYVARAPGGFVVSN